MTFGHFWLLIPHGLPLRSSGCWPHKWRGSSSSCPWSSSSRTPALLQVNVHVKTVASRWSPNSNSLSPEWGGDSTLLSGPWGTLRLTLRSTKCLSFWERLSPRIVKINSYVFKGVFSCILNYCLSAASFCLSIFGFVSFSSFRPTYSNAFWLSQCGSYQHLGRTRATLYSSSS